MDKGVEGPQNVFQGRKTKKVIRLTNTLLNFSDTSDDILLFDFIKNEWERIVPTGHSNLMKSQDRHPMFITTGSSVCMIGGRQNSQFNIFERLTLRKNEGSYIINWESFDLKGSIPFRRNHSSEHLNGVLYMFGGKDYSGNVCPDFFVLNLETLSYQIIITKGLGPGPRYDHSSLKYNEKMYIFGGIGDKEIQLNDMWVWDLKYSYGWERLFPESKAAKGILPVPRSLAFVQIFKDFIFILKGKAKEEICEDLLLYKSDSNQWEDLSHRSSGFKKLPFTGEAHFMNINNYTGSLLIVQNLNIYEMDIMCLYQPLDKVENSKETKIAKDFEDFKYNFKRIYQEKLFPDIIFKAEEEEIPAHKGILAGRSKYFENMFSSGMIESQKQVIEIPNIKADVFKALLEYLYCDDTEITEQIALDLLRSANEYSLDELKKKCGDFLKENLETSSIIEIANTALLCEVDDLKKAALRFIRTNLEEIKTVHDIKKLDTSLLYELISTGK